MCLHRNDVGESPDTTHGGYVYGAACGLPPTHSGYEQRLGPQMPSAQTHRRYLLQHIRRGHVQGPAHLDKFDNIQTTFTAFVLGNE